MKLKYSVISGVVILSFFAYNVCYSKNSTEVNAEYTNSSFMNSDNNKEKNRVIHFALNQINHERSNRGLYPLKLNSKMSKIANERVKQVITNFTHNNFENVLANGSYVSVFRESIGYMYNTNYSFSQNVVNTINGIFYNDSKNNFNNRKNLLSKDINSIGIGFYQTSDNKLYSVFDMSDIDKK